MQEQPMEQQALGTWESEGGRTRPLTPIELQRNDPDRCLPTLPPGYEVQPLWGFSDQFSLQLQRWLPALLHLQARLENA